MHPRELSAVRDAGALTALAELDDVLATTGSRAELVDELRTHLPGLLLADRITLGLQSADASQVEMTVLVGDGDDTDETYLRPTAGSSLQRARDIGVLIFLIVAAGIGAGCYLAFRPSITLICTPDDFTLVHRNAREVFYLQSHPWTDLISSRYEETVQRNYRQGRMTESRTRTFAIDLRDGYGVTFSESTEGFRDLIGTVGQMTAHIPYLWVPASGALGRVVERSGDYALVARNPAEVPQAIIP